VHSIAWSHGQLPLLLLLSPLYNPIPAIPGSLKLDRDACANIGAVLTPCHGEMRELKGEHHHKVVEISESAGKCLEEEYLVSGH
jgi:hypothetical protein